MSTFVTADLHFGHYLPDLGRPYTDAQMDDLLIQNWNRVVNPGDEVWVLGDFALHLHKTEMERVFIKLNGSKHLIEGNHDGGNNVTKLRWASAHQTHMLRVGDNYFWLSHYSHRIWPRKHYGVYHLYGHSHGNLPGIGRSMDVGVDVKEHNYTPVAIEDIVTKLSPIKFEGEFHH